MLSDLVARMLAASLLAIIAGSAQTNCLQFRSAPQRTALLELYTSEGCSSCPPAEAWLSGLKDSPRLWQDFAPVAFHVDYWNYLGWKDAWSDGEFAERQRSYAQLWRAENIYTPEFVLNGQEWHGWFTGKSGPKSAGENAGVLIVTSMDANRWRVVFAPEKLSALPYEVHAALLAGGIVSAVKAGENNGRQLKHDFVVVRLVHIGLTASNGVARGRFSIPAPKASPGTTRALVAWVTQLDELQPIQVTGGWLLAPGND
jgi:hypothetical protein